MTNKYKFFVDDDEHQLTIIKTEPGKLGLITIMNITLEEIEDKGTNIVLWKDEAKFIKEKI